MQRHETAAMHGGISLFQTVYYKEGGVPVMNPQTYGDYVCDPPTCEIQTLPNRFLDDEASRIIRPRNRERKKKPADGFHLGIGRIALLMGQTPVGSPMRWWQF
jgi:hypothetical protein